MLSRRTDAARKHEIELLWFPYFVVRIWVPNVVLPTELAELLARKVVQLSSREYDARHYATTQGTHLRKSTFIRLDRLVRQLHRDALDFFLLLFVVLLDLLCRLAPCLAIAREPRLEDALDEVIRTEDIPRLGILDHPVGEPCDVARRLEHGRGRHDGRIELEHVIVDDEMATPFGDDVRLERGSGWAVVVESCDACVGSVSRGCVMNPGTVCAPP